MPDPKLILVFFEGDDDGAVLKEVRDAKLLPATWDLAHRDKGQHRGKDGLVRQMIPFISPANGVGGNAVALVDLDELTLVQRFDWFGTQLHQELRRQHPDVQIADGPAPSDRIRLFQLIAGERIGRVAVVGAGLPADNTLTETYKIDRFAIDDWILRLIQHEQVFSAVSDLNSVPYAVAMAKFIEVAALFRKNGLEVRKSKTYVQILRALAAIAPSTATIVGRLVKKSIEKLPRDVLRATFHPLLDDLEAAMNALATG